MSKIDEVLYLYPICDRSPLLNNHCSLSTVCEFHMHVHNLIKKIICIQKDPRLLSGEISDIGQHIATMVKTMCVAPHLIMKGADIKSVQYFICIYMCFSQYTYCSRSPSCNLHRDPSTWPESNRGLFSQKDEKLHTAGLDDTAILLIEIKLTKILLKKKSSILQYHKPRFSPR